MNNDEGKKLSRLATFLRIYEILSFIIFGPLLLGFVFQTHLLSERGGPLNWLIWDDVTGHVGPMLFVVYLTWAVFFFIAARKPRAYVSFLNFTMWANLVHGLLMVIQALTMIGHYWSKWLTDIPFILILALGIYFWRPSSNEDEGVHAFAKMDR